jgi:uncharacterized membrane protein YqjE
VSESPPSNAAQLTDASKRILRRVLTIGANRFELLLVEVQEERERLLRAILLALGVAAFCLLAGMALTCTIVVLLPEPWRAGALLVLTGSYGATALWLYRRLTRLLRDWQNLPATLDQLRKDHAWLEKHIA